ncbi:uncharacterized protein PAC_11093 [Phialocephala subalpina]|uniref:NADH:flavin oxidoreductase/NADH oxidase N-terminal domain-containing protein n=1 Tax=Phialocephala subalpina TaxID=576137 RepID=A0A1L7X870_9HELO|nr:uncharacterized protein PAC_11093 [Phialocephala subalpina]
MESPKKLTPTQILAQPLTLPCGLVLPNRLVNCPMQETLASEPFFDPPIKKFKNIYGERAASKYGLIITGQVQIDIRLLSIAGDSEISREHGTSTIMQLAQPGRTCPAGAGIRPADMAPLCPSSVPVHLSDS